MFDSITEVVGVIIFLNIYCYTGHKEEWLKKEQRKILI